MNTAENTFGLFWTPEDPVSAIKLVVQRSPHHLAKS